MKQKRWKFTLGGEWWIYWAASADAPPADLADLGQPMPGTEAPPPGTTGSDHGPVAQSGGFCYYCLQFDHTPDSAAPHAEILLTAPFAARLWLNGVRLGELPERVPAAFVVSRYLRTGPNLLVLSEGRPTSRIGDSSALQTGGLTAPTLASMPRQHIESVFVKCDLRRERIMIEVASNEKLPVRAQIAGTDAAVEGPPGELMLPFNSFTAWTLTQPVLHQVHVSLLENGAPIDVVTIPFAMREFGVKDRRFHLNGGPIHVKALSLPPHRLCSIEIIARAKQAGFNLLLLGAGQISDELLASAASLGILVGVTLPDAPKPSQPLWESIIRRYRGSPGIALWRLAPPANAEEEAAIVQLRRLDPTRLLWCEADCNAGSPSRIVRPFRSEFEGVSIIPVDAWLPLETAPFHYLQRVGAQDRLSFVHLITRPSGEARAAWEGPRDAAEGPMTAAAASDSGAVDRTPQRPLEPLPSSAEELERTAAGLSRAARYAQLDALRGNPRLAGYALEWPPEFDRLSGGSEEQDAFWEGLAVRQAPLQLLIHIANKTLKPRDDADVIILLANEARVEERMDLSLQVVGPTGQVLWKKKRAVKLPKHTQELWAGSIGASGSTGRHSFVARLIKGNRILAESTMGLFVAEPGPLPASGVHVLDPSGEWSTALEGHVGADIVLAPLHVVPPLANTIRAYPDNVLLQSLAQVAGGAVMLVFQPPPDWNDFAAAFAPDLLITQIPLDARSGVVFHYARMHPVLEQLPNRTLMDQTYANILPRKVFLEVGEEAISGAWQFDPEPVFVGNSVLVRRFGAGQVVFTHWRLLESLARDPVAARLLGNVLQHFARRSLPPDAPLPLNQRAVEWMRRERLEKIRRWMVIGEWDNRPPHDGHNMAYPPELGVDFTAIYPGWYRAIEWRPYFTRAECGHRLCFYDALPAPTANRPRADAATAHAYAEFSADKRQDCLLRIQSSNALKVWLNEKLVLERTPDNDSSSFREDDTAAYLRQGKNSLLVKCSKTCGPFEFSLDITSPEGEPLQTHWWK